MRCLHQSNTPHLYIIPGIYTNQLRAYHPPKFLPSALCLVGLVQLQSQLQSRNGNGRMDGACSLLARLCWRSVVCVVHFPAQSC